MSAAVERIVSWVGFHLARVPEPIVRHLTVRRPVAVAGQRLDARTQHILLLMDRAGPGPLESLPLERARREYLGMSTILDAPDRSLPRVEDERIPGPDSTTIPVRIYGPGADRSPRPALVYLHGGGGVIGSIDTHDPLCRLLCRELEGPVISVDYRLAPEHPFPAAVDDALAAYRWVREHAARLGVDPERIAVGGDSLGGNLAAVVAQQARDHGEPPPRAQLLIYPTTDRTVITESMRTFAQGFLLTADLMKWFMDSYLGSSADVSDPRISPLRHPDLSGLAPAVVVTAGFDPLRDEGQAYADALRDAGGTVRYRCCEGLVHGFAQMTGTVERAERGIRDAVADLRALMRGA